MSKRKIELTLPFLRAIGGEQIGAIVDGEQVVGINNIIVRSGDNGYTNVTMEVAAETAIKMVAALEVVIDENHFNQLIYPFSAMYEQAHKKVVEQLAFDGKDINDSPEAKAKIVCNLIELLASQAKKYTD